MVFTRTLRNVSALIVAFGLVVAAVWLVASNQAKAASPTPVVYVATGENFPDALGAGPVAAMVKGPVLLVRQNTIPFETVVEITRLAPDKIVIVGGTGVISSAVETQLQAIASTVERIAGADRYATAAMLSAATYPASFDADTLDGNDSTAFLGATAKAADSDLLDGMDSSAFLGKTEKAADSDLLDGKDLSVLVPRAGTSVSDSIGSGTGVEGQALLSADITAPARGVLLINASADSFGGPALVPCWITLDGVVVEGSIMFSEVDAAGNPNEDCTTVGAVQSVDAGTHTVSFLTTAATTVTFLDGTLTVLWVPFDGSGNTPP